MMSENGDTQNELIQQETSRKWYTSIPNIIEEMDLNPYEYRLYVHIRKVIGETDGSCWQSTKTLSKECKMSTGAVSKAKKGLAKKGLILIQKVPHAGYDAHNITVVNIWKKNHERYLELKEDQRSRSEAQRSPGETKKNPVRKKIEDSNESSPAPNKRTRKRSELDVLKSELITFFSEVSGISKPRCSTKGERSAAGRLWWSPLVRIADLVDRDIERSKTLIEWAVRHADSPKNKLIISTPLSIEKLCISEHGRRLRQNGHTKRSNGHSEEAISVGPAFADSEPEQLLEYQNAPGSGG